MDAPTVVRRMARLALLELVNVGLLAWVFFGAFDVPATAPNLVGYGLMALVLLEGAGYWAAKHRQVRTGAASPPAITTFRRLRRINVVALAAGAIVIVVASWRDPGTRSWPGVGFWAFALAEHVNYFHVQLMHDTAADVRRLLRTRRLRRSHLAVDLDRSRGPSPTTVRDHR